MEANRIYQIFLQFHLFDHSATYSFVKGTKSKGSNVNGRQSTSTATHKHCMGVDVRTDCKQEPNTAWQESTACILCAITLPKLFPFYLVLCPSSFRVSRNTASWEMS